MSVGERIAFEEGLGSSDDDELTRVLADYLAEVEAGKAVDPEELIAGHPAIADRLRTCLKGLHLVEEFASSIGVGAAKRESGADGPTLGDFRIRPHPWSRRNGRRLRSRAGLARPPRRAQGASLRCSVRSPPARSIPRRVAGSRPASPPAHHPGLLRWLGSRRALLRHAVDRRHHPGPDDLRAAAAERRKG